MYIRNLHNYTEDTVFIEDLGLTVEPSDKINLFSNGAEAIDISNSEDLLQLLAKGTDQFQLEENDRYYDFAEGIKLITQVHSISKTDNEGKTVVVATPKPEGTSVYFASHGDSAEHVGDDETSCLLFNLTDTDSSVSKEVSFLEDVYLKNGYFYLDTDIIGITITADIIHPLAGKQASFIKKAHLFPKINNLFHSDDLGLIPKGMKIKITINNSEGDSGKDPAGTFRVLGVFKVYRKHSIDFE